MAKKIVEDPYLSNSILNTLFPTSVILGGDWVIKLDSKWSIAKIKYKSAFEPPPFYGQGLYVGQVLARQKLYAETGMRCLFVCIDVINDIIYWQWLDVLEATDHHMTKNGMRIYDLSNFEEIKYFSEKIK